MNNKDKKPTGPFETDSPQVRLLRCTYPDCGTDSLFKGWPGYVCQQFIKAVVYTPAKRMEGHDESDEIAETRVVYERRLDGSINEDFDGDNYSRSHYDKSFFFACAYCGEGLQFEDGRDVETDEELAEWLIQNREQSGNEEHQEVFFSCPECGNDRFLRRKRVHGASERVISGAEDSDDKISEKNLDHVCAKCGWQAPE